MGKDIHQTLHRLGYESFREKQEDAINCLLNGQHALVVLPTGIGKSLIYQIASLHTPGVALVISPLIALMKDQVDKLQQLGIPATFINSTLSQEEQLERIERMVKGEYQLVYVAPERLRQYFFREDIGRIRVGLLAVDEAHCISHWGHDFRPDYLYIKSFREFVGNPITAALTATATPRVKNEIRNLLGINDAQQLTTSFDRPNIKIEVEEVTSHYKRESQKLAMIAGQLERWVDGAAIIYVGRRNDAEYIAGWISRSLGKHADYYHGGLEGLERADIQNRFMNGQSHLVVATNAFGMGIDRADVRLIIHHTFPGSIEAYFQEIGRAGRDRQLSRAVMFYDSRDQSLHDYFIECGTLGYDDLAGLYNYLTALANGKPTVWVRLRSLSKKFDWDKEGTKARVGLERLEQAGTIIQGHYEGLDHLIHLSKWDNAAIMQVLINVQRHIKHRRALLTTIMDYGQNTTRCRRQTILNYFGDNKQPGQNRRCCDICDRYRPARSPKPERPKEPKQSLEDRIQTISEATREHPTMAHWIKRQKATPIADKGKPIPAKRSGSEKHAPTKKKKFGQPVAEVSQAMIFKAIIGCVMVTPGQLNKKLLAQILIGSQPGKTIFLEKHPQFGSLIGIPRRWIEQEIDTLVRLDYLQYDKQNKLIPGPKAVQQIQ